MSYAFLVESPWKPVGRKIAFTMAILFSGAAFLLCYGAVIPMLAWVALVMALAWLSRRRCETLAAAWFSMSIGGLLLWPIDACNHFPFLRALHSIVPFGPQIDIFPSPSGRCTAYVYNHSFVDSAYRVRFAHSLSFPGDGHWVPLGTYSDATLASSWNGGVFTADAVGLPLCYDETTRTVSFPKGE